MTNDRQIDSSHRIGPGASTVLMILLVLCMTLLGALSLISVRNDLSVTKRSVQAETAFYTAQAKAAETLAGLESTLYEMRLTSATDADWQAALNSMENYDCETGVWRYLVPVDSHRNIQISVRILGRNADHAFDTLCNQVVIIPEDVPFEDMF